MHHYLFATCHNTSRFSKILQIIVEYAWQRRFLWRLVIEVVKLCNVNINFGLESLRSYWTLLITIISYVIVHHHPWFIFHESFFHDDYKNVNPCWILHYRLQCFFFLSCCSIVLMQWFPLTSRCNHDVHNSLKLVMVMLCTLQPQQTHHIWFFFLLLFWSIWSCELRCFMEWLSFPSWHNHDAHNSLKFVLIILCTFQLQ